ncbi:MAG TPA: HupE/UreJ family protein [Polyangia bacterium]|nr:HupE/UreJ family protein [Polyangia bacterium]
MKAPVALLATIVVLGATAPAGAHQQTTSYSAIAYPVEGGDVTWRIRFRPEDVARISATSQARDLIGSALRVTATGAHETRTCPRTATTLAPDPSAPEPALLFQARFTCGPGARVLHLRYDVLFDHDPYHASYVRLDVGEPANDADSQAAAAVFWDRQREISVDVHQPEPLWRSALLYLRLGVAHILTGADHLAFLLALLLATAVRPDRAVRGAIGICSAFTVAHSITLALQVLRPGLVPTRWVEPAIALSVAFVAVENLLPRPPRGRLLLVFAFGLIHGLGFASALREIGLPRRGLILSLVAFNLGVELGQLLIVGLALPVFVTAARHHPARYQRWALHLGSAAIAVMGLAWLVARLVNL